MSSERCVSGSHLMEKYHTISHTGLKNLIIIGRRGKKQMTHLASSSRKQMTQQLSAAQQAVDILRKQLQAGMVDKDYWGARLTELSELLVEVETLSSNADHQRKLGALYEVSQVIGSSLQLEQVLNQVMDSIIELSGAERGFLLLYDDRNELEVVAARNMDHETLGAEDFAISRSVIEMVAQAGEPVVTTNAVDDPRFARRDSVMTHNLRSIQAVPLRARGQILGVVYVDNRIRAGVFDEDDLELLAAFSGQAAVAIENARLFTKTDEALDNRIAELSRMQEIDQELNATLDFSRVMGLTLDWAVRVAQADNGAIALIDLEEGETKVVAQHGSTPSGVLTMLGDAYSLDGDREDSLTVPIQREGRVIGVIGLARADQKSFAPEAFSFASRLADHAAIAIENAQLYEAVKRANETKNEFVSVMAHELRVPMTSIKGYTDMISMVGELSEQQSRYLNVIRSNVERMTVLVNDLSDIARLESGRLPLEIEDNIQPASVLNELLPTLKGEIEQREHDVHIDIPTDLPEVRADPRRVTQIFVNLISNAFKYTPNGGTITVHAVRQSGYVRCEVTDTGVGMTPEEVSKLFTKFWRAEDAYVRDQPGSGLGLTIAKNLVELQGGEMTVSSQKNHGTTFSFTLPISE